MTIEHDWEKLKKSIKTKWTKLTDSEIEKFKDNIDAISSKIQHLYGYTKEHAEKEYKDFKSTFISPQKPILKPKVHNTAEKNHKINP